MAINTAKNLSTILNWKKTVFGQMNLEVTRVRTETGLMQQAVLNAGSPALESGVMGDQLHQRISVFLENIVTGL